MRNEEIIEKITNLYSEDWDRFYSEQELYEKLNINNDELEEALSYFCRSEKWGAVWTDYSGGKINYRIQPIFYADEYQERFRRLDNRLKKKYGKIGTKFARFRLFLRIQIASNKCLLQLLGTNNIKKLKNILV